MYEWASRWVLIPVAYFIAALLFVLAATTVVKGQLFSGVAIALLALVFLPPVWKAASRLLGHPMPVGARAGVLFVLLIGVGIAAGADEQRLAEQRAIEAANDRRARFEAARDSLYARVHTLIDVGEFQAAADIANEWRDIRDDSLHALGLRAAEAAGARQDSVQEAELVRHARTVPASNTAENIRIYQELVSLDPDNGEYQSKLDHYQQQKAAEAEQRRLANKWSYSRSTDSMTGRTSYSARIRSENTVNFDFPYRGPQRGALILRTHPSYGQDVIFRIEKGQILCHSYGDCRIRVRFDEGSPVTWGGNPSSDQQSTVVFLNSYNSFVSRLRRARVVRIQPEIYQEGQPVFEFHVGGFDHNRYRGR